MEERDSRFHRRKTIEHLQDTGQNLQVSTRLPEVKQFQMNRRKDHCKPQVNLPDGRFHGWSSYMKTRSVLFGFAVVSVLLAFAVAPVAAVKPVLENAPYLVAKNMAAGWVESEDLGIGHFMYPNRGADLQLDAENLTPGPTEYAMISYREPAEGGFLTAIHNVLKIGSSDENGTLKMKIGTGAFLKHLICNTYAEDAPGDYQDITGAKVWIVPTSDLVMNEEAGTAMFTAWTPAAYLFESDLITQTCQAEI
jgi:hypothetical protein